MPKTNQTVEPREFNTKETHMTQLELKKILKYDSKTGEFIWIRKSTGVTVGSIAGTNKDGYIRIIINGKAFYAQNLVWLYIHGRFPKDILDHKNRKRYDNRISNLRNSDSALNMKNKSKYKRNTSGITGVTFDKSRNKWKAFISINKKVVNLGRFNTKNEAVLARKNEELIQGYDSSHGL